MYNRCEIENELRNMISELVGIASKDISIDDTLLGGKLLIDSIILLSFIVDIEEKFNITFEDDEISIEYFETIEDVVNLLERKLSLK